MSTGLYCGEKKHPGGKLVKICIKLYGDVVRGVLLTGDFFVEPEEEFEKLRAFLMNIEVPLNNVVSAILDTIRRYDVKFHGIDLIDIKEAIERAMEIRNK